MIIWGEAINEMDKFEPKSIDTIFTSPNPPFFHEQTNDHLVGGEETTADYLNHLIAIFNSCYRVLKDAGSLYVHMGDMHDDHETGNLMLIPEQFAINMVKFGWIIRDNIIWHRTERIHESSYDKTRHRRDAERVFRFVKIPSAYFDTKGHSYYRSSVQSFPYDPRRGSGFPYELVDMAIKESCPRNGIILDPMAGSGTTGAVAKLNNRPYILIDMVKEMVDMMKKRLGAFNDGR